MQPGNGVLGMGKASQKKLLIAALPIVGALMFLWFPFDWLSEVFPAFGVPFRMVFRNAHSHFVGHSIFFFVIGSFSVSSAKSVTAKTNSLLCHDGLRRLNPRIDSSNVSASDCEV